MMDSLVELDVNIGFNDMRDWGCYEATKGILSLKNLKRLRLSLS